MLGSARNFLEFAVRGQMELAWDKNVLLYGLAAMGACVLIMTLPALKHSRLTIVKLKQQKALKKRSWWEKCFLDMICLAVALYGYYSFSRHQGTLVENVLLGEPLDPLLYISSSLFIVGMGLVFLRLQPLLVRESMLWEGGFSDRQAMPPLWKLSKMGANNSLSCCL